MIGSPVGSLVPGGVSCGVVVPFLKSTLVTNWVGGATMVLISGPTTWALGKVFIQHFETGGTLLDLNPDESPGVLQSAVPARAKDGHNHECPGEI